MAPTIAFIEMYRTGLPRRLYWRCISDRALRRFSFLTTRGRLARRQTTRSRASFSRSTIPPRASSPIKWNVFLPGSIPMVTARSGSLWHGVVLLVILVPECPTTARSCLGREHGRSIPFSDILVSRRLTGAPATEEATCQRRGPVVQTIFPAAPPCAGRQRSARHPRGA
jgi:hypothetical protein